jgi:multidrug efflux pump subunit AcrA (membrane-fusion protein)
MRASGKVVDDPRTTTWAPSSPQARDLDDTREHYGVVLARYRLHAADHAPAVDIARAEAQLAQAELALCEAQHPIASQALTLARLDVERARLALEAAQESLSRSTLTAPFDGIISAVPASVGEWASPGTPVVELIGISRWHVETNNVGELQIARVRAAKRPSCVSTPSRASPCRDGWRPSRWGRWCSSETRPTR